MARAPRSIGAASKWMHVGYRPQVMETFLVAAACPGPAASGKSTCGFPLCMSTSQDSIMMARCSPAQSNPENVAWLLFFCSQGFEPQARGEGVSNPQDQGYADTTPSRVCQRTAIQRQGGASMSEQLVTGGMIPSRDNYQNQISTSGCWYRVGRDHPQDRETASVTLRSARRLGAREVIGPTSVHYGATSGRLQIFHAAEHHFREGKSNHD
ncbi:hypothetical protein EV356DRAFT_517784 [Viridothelium virens]|uniref:Uncharacterized protein n=1 Tax=Viridothelium virens TaxID=1048519 RepID=A0A6A6HK19_VIRVR|nr:hypothetical protein EV356DRAFT_517784 [Viridothelium virens]